MRTLALGLIGVTWALLVSDSNSVKSLNHAMPRTVLFIGGLAVLSLFLDLLQYVFGYWVADRLRRKMESEEVNDGQFDYESFAYRAQSFCFYSKVAVVSIAAGVFLVKLGLYFRTPG